MSLCYVSVYVMFYLFLKLLQKKFKSIFLFSAHQMLHCIALYKGKILKSCQLAMKNCAFVHIGVLEGPTMHKGIPLGVSPKTIVQFFIVNLQPFKIFPL